MILRALYDLYHRMEGLPPFGAELREIEYVIVLGADGSFKRIETNRVDKKKCKAFFVPKAVNRTSGVAANSLWDNVKYVLQHGKHNVAFVARLKEIAAAHPEVPALQATLKFYATAPEERDAAMASDPLYEEAMNNATAYFTFFLEGDSELLAEKTYLVDAEDADDTSDEPEGVCLITGRRGPIVRLSTPTPLAGNSPKASLVSMQPSSGFDSYGKKQAYNAPISPEAEFAFSSALKGLMGKESKSKAFLGGRSFFFWGTGEQAQKVEEALPCMFGIDPDKKKKDPMEKFSHMESLLRGIWSGKIATELDDRFYTLGLAPNVGRIAVVEWNDAPLREFAHRILQHFDDMDILDTRPAESRWPYKGVYAMISNVTLGGKVSDAVPSLVQDVFTAVMQGTPYPFPLYSAALERIRAEVADTKKPAVSIGRVAILKAYINRKHRNNANIQSLNTMLDKSNTNPAYLCGRLAAVLEKIQEDVKRGDSIRTRYLAAASATPAAMFPAMLNLSVHHSDLLSEGSYKFYEKLKGEIIGLMPADGFPSRLDIVDQGRFFVGYYQQRQDLYTKKSDNND